MFHFQNYIKMKIFIISWTALLKDTLPAIHECYLEAFKAIASDKAKSWTMEDTKKRQGLSPKLIWQDETLWGDYAAEAQEAFYSCFAEFPIAEIREEAWDLLCRLDRARAKVYLVSMKTKALMLQEVGNAGLATYAKGFFGFDGKISGNTSTLVSLVKHSVGNEHDDFVVVASEERYAFAAQAHGCEFVSASKEGLDSIAVDY